MEQKIDIEPIKLSDVERMVDSVKKNLGDTDADLSFEFILTAFFPTCWNNVQDALKQQYTLGYIAGMKEACNQYNTKDDAECFCD